MELLNEVIEKAEEAHHNIEIECFGEASLAICELETLLTELPASVEDWAHALRDEFKLFCEAKQWMRRDHVVAQEKIALAVERFREINRDARRHDVAPEFVEDYRAGP